MKNTKPIHTLNEIILLASAVSDLSAAPLGTAFTYQGRLNDGASPASGVYDLRFAVYDADERGTQIGPAITNSSVMVADGLFTVLLDFGSVFDGDARWLEVSVRTNGGGRFTPLSPLQPLSPAPYALYAVSAATAAGAVGGSGTAEYLARFSDTQTLGNSVIRQAGANVGIGGVPEEKLDVSGGNILVRGAGGFDATGEQATLFLGDGNHFIQGVFGTGVVVRTWSGERVSVDGGDLLVRGADNFAGSGSVATAFLGDTAHFLRAKREFGLTLGTWPAGEVFCVREPLGRVGIGTTEPQQRLDVNGGHMQVRGPGGFDAAGEQATLFLGDGNHFIQGIYGAGVKIGTWSGEKVELDHGDLLVHGADNFAGAGSVATAYLGDTAHYLRATREYGLALGNWPVGDALTIREPNGYVGIGTNAPQAKLHVVGTTRTSVLEITGGSDVAEPFEVSDAEPIPKGSVLVIDEREAGRLRLSRRPYDKRVAGVVSGANGLLPGLTLSQQGRTDTGVQVALSGRVYVRADAAMGAIEPGDLLTTSSVPGHAMKVTDPAQAQGAILGKAMSSLREGQDLVLVLVTLQ